MSHNTYPPPLPGKSPARPPTRPLLHNPAQTPTRKPSLSSPSPPTPLIPSFNAAASRPVPPPQNQTNPAQYVTFQRSCTVLPDSPTSRAMMKRLLAKPAAPAGYPYSGSESEGRGVTRPVTMNGWKSEDGGVPAKSEERRRDASAAEQRSLEVTRSATMNGCRSEDGSTSIDEHPSGGNLEERQRDERRIHEKAEEKRRDEATAPASKFEEKRRDVVSPSPTERRINGKSEEKPRKLVRRKPSTLPVSPGSSTTVKRSMSAAALSPRSAQPLTPSPSPKPTSLTPASALVEAYRAQEQMERVHDVTSPSPPTPSANKPPQPQKRAEDEAPATPYYTVFGSSSDRVVPVDSREAHTAEWTAQGYLDGVQRSATVKSTGSSPSSGGGFKTLTRKVSGRWKKPQLGDEERGRPRPSLQSAGRKDEPAAAPPRTRSLSIEHSSGGLKTLTRKVSGRRKVGEGRGRHSRRPSVVEVEEGGSKLWRLVKRISTGGLRDKYRAESPPPPVPTLDSSKKHPAAVSRLLPSTSSSRSSSASTRHSRVRTTSTKAPAHTASSSSPVSSSSSKFWKGAQSPHSSTSSFSEVPPVPVLNKLRKKKSTVGRHIVPPSELSKDFQSTPPPSFQTPHRPQTADSEEWMIVKSPDVELPSLPFPPRRAQAPKEDVPESGRESPLLPEFSISGAVNAFPARRAVDKPPLSPTRAASSPTSSSFQLRKSESNVDRGMNRRSEGGLSMLTIRPGRGSSSYGDSSPSPLMAVFAPQSTVPRAADGSKPSSSSCAGSSQPSVSAAKPPAAKSSASNSSGTNSSATNASGTNSSATKTPAAKYPAIESLATKSPTTRSPALSSPSPSSHGLSRHHTLSEQEKTKRWDDLLERSARAGGTLHLAGDLMLQSDTLRFSTTPSELSSVTLLV